MCYRGIIQQSHGKELYLWRGISRADIEIADSIKLKYFNMSNTQTGSLNFERKEHKLFMDILIKNVRAVNQMHSAN